METSLYGCINISPATIAASQPTVFLTDRHRSGCGSFTAPLHSDAPHTSLPPPQFPYYVIKERWPFYVYGSQCYALYFWGSFPMYWQLEEHHSSPKVSLWNICVSSLGCGMLVTILLEAWRLCIGRIVEYGDVLGQQSASLPFLDMGSS